MCVNPGHSISSIPKPKRNASSDFETAYLLVEGLVDGHIDVDRSLGE